MSDKIIVTVQGVDKIGIVAAVTAKMAELDVNIEDIKQTLMQGHFVMFMLCNIEKSTHSFKDIKEGMLELGEELGMEIWVQKKEIFDNMHKI
jgi:ACT domain-containing protein